MKHVAHVATAARHFIEVEPGLLAILNLKIDGSAVRTPRDVDDEHGRRIGNAVDPHRVAGSEIGDVERCGGVRITGQRVRRHFELLMQRKVIDNRELGHLGVIELQISDGARIGTPPVRLEDSAAVDLLLIHPVEQTVDDLLRAVGRELPLGLRGHVDREQIAVADERDELAVRAERRFLLIAGSAREARQCLRRDVVDVQIFTDRQQHSPSAPVDGDRTRAGELFRVIARHALHLCDLGLQLIRIEERGLLARDGVHEHEARHLAGRGRTRKVEMRFVGPREAARLHGSRRNAFRAIVNVVDREAALRRLRRRREAQGEKNDHRN